jgi:hypothetical protein
MAPSKERHEELADLPVGKDDTSGKVCCSQSPGNEYRYLRQSRIVHLERESPFLSLVLS